MADNYYVQIVQFSDDAIEKEMGPFTDRKADLVDGGVNRNLNHDKFFTKIIQKDVEA